MSAKEKGLYTVKCPKCSHRFTASPKGKKAKRGSAVRIHPAKILERVPPLGWILIVLTVYTLARAVF